METTTPLKRQREDEEEIEIVKRQKSYKEILSILDEEEDEPNQDLSYLITTLQQEISGNEIDPSEEDESEKVMRHLLEASDDELGIPTTADDTVAAAGEVDGGDWLMPMAGGEGLLWEIEDEAANYYTLLQSELFL